MDEVLLVNRLVFAAHITGRILLRTSPYRVGSTEVAVHSVCSTIDIIADSSLAICTCMRTCFTAFAGCHLCYRGRTSLYLGVKAWGVAPGLNQG